MAKISLTLECVECGKQQPVNLHIDGNELTLVDSALEPQNPFRITVTGALDFQAQMAMPAQWQYTSVGPMCALCLRTLAVTCSKAS